LPRLFLCLSARGAYVVFELRLVRRDGRRGRCHGDLLTQLVSFLVDETVLSAPVVVNSVLKLLAFFLLLLGLVGLYAHQAEDAGPLGLVGCLAAFVGPMLLSGDLWLEAFAFPYFRYVAPR
jgi:hypothetical protein